MEINEKFVISTIIGILIIIPLMLVGVHFNCRGMDAEMKKYYKFNKGGK